MSTATTTKERPLILRAEEVRAVLDGKKTQHRVPTGGCSGWVSTGIWVANPEPSEPPVFDEHSGFWAEPRFGGWRKRCPFGRPGDRLYIREALRCVEGIGLVYDADRTPVQIPPEHQSEPFAAYLSAAFVPRWASRLTLEVESVRVERVQSVAEEDAKACGACCTAGHPHGAPDQHRAAFAVAWDAKHAKRTPWSANPWVWVVSFKVVRP